MADMVPAIDVSQWQGIIDFSGVPQEIVIIKASGGDNGLYFDSKCSQNYSNAVAAGKSVALYHFAGGTDPVAEANFFLRSVSPLAKNDVYILDWEIQHTDPVGWSNSFMQTVHNATGAWPLLYINISTCNAYDWSSVLANSPLYIAAPSYGWEDTIPVKYPVSMQQGPYIADPGVSGNLDSDMWFSTLDGFKACGYQTPVPAVPTEPAEPVTPPDNPPVVPEPPVVAPVTITTTGSSTTTVYPPVTVEPVSEPQKPVAWYTKVVLWLQGLLQKLKLKG